MSPNNPEPLHRRIPRELPEHAAEDVCEFRNMTLKERALMLEAVCAAAMDIQEARAKLGLYPGEPDPWPDSTRDFLKRHAPRGRRAKSTQSD